MLCKQPLNLLTLLRVLKARRRLIDQIVANTFCNDASLSSVRDLYIFHQVYIRLLSNAPIQMIQVCEALYFLSSFVIQVIRNINALNQRFSTDPNPNMGTDPLGLWTTERKKNV